MTVSDKKFNWTGEHQETVNLLKTHLISAPVLGYPDFQDLLIWTLMHCFKDWVLFCLEEMRMAKAGLLHMSVGPCIPMNEQCKIIVQPR